MSGRKNDTSKTGSAGESSGRPALAVTILLALGGFATLAIALEGARTWSWWASAVLTSWNVGGSPVAPELFIYPAFFTMVLALSRPAPRDVTARFLATGMLWSAGLFLADPALRVVINNIAPESAHSAAAATVRGTALYGLLFAWMYLTFRNLIPSGKGPLAETEPSSNSGSTKMADDEAGKDAP